MLRLVFFVATLLKFSEGGFFFKIKGDESWCLCEKGAFNDACTDKQNLKINCCYGRNNETICWIVEYGVNGKHSMKIDYCNSATRTTPRSKTTTISLPLTEEVKMTTQFPSEEKLNFANTSTSQMISENKTGHVALAGGLIVSLLLNATLVAVLGYKNWKIQSLATTSQTKEKEEKETQNLEDGEETNELYQVGGQELIYNEIQEEGQV